MVDYTREAENCSAHKAGYLSSTDLALKAWTIPRESMWGEQHIWVLMAMKERSDKMAQLTESSKDRQSLRPPLLGFFVSRPHAGRVLPTWGIFAPPKFIPLGTISQTCPEICIS